MGRISIRMVPPATPILGRGGRGRGGDRAPWSFASYESRLSFLSARSTLSFLSAGSILSIGSAGSILSIGSAGSILSIGSAGSILSIGKAGALSGRRQHARETVLDGAATAG